MPTQTDSVIRRCPFFAIIPVPFVPTSGGPRKRGVLLRRRSRRRFRPEPDRNEPRVNGRIRVRRVLVIDEEGNKLGEFLTQDAIQLAEDRGLDLVEVAPNARPPVCKIADYGRMKYEKSKAAAQARRNQVQQQLKEVKLRPKTDDHDMAVKSKHARRFLEEGHKVKVTVRFRGREHAHRDIGTSQCMAIAEACNDLGGVESRPRMDGRQMFMILAPNKRPAPKRKKPREFDDRAPQHDDAEGQESGEE